MSPQANTNEDSEGSPEIEEPNEYHNFPDTSPRQTRGKNDKDLARFQKCDTVLPRLRKDDDDASGMGGHTRSGAAKFGFVLVSSKSSLSTTTESNEKGGSSNKGQNRGAVNSLEMLKDYEDNRAIPERSYCTQACLLGLIRGHTLDKQCPNIEAHRKGARYYSRNSTNGKIHHKLMELFIGGTDRECVIWNMASIEKLLLIVLFVCDMTAVAKKLWK